MHKAFLVGRDEESAGYLGRALKHADFCCEYSDAVDAVQRLATSNPDIVVLDFPLLDDAALVLCRRLCELYEVPLVVCSMSTNEADVIRAFDAGADDYLVIPIRPAEMTARLHATIRRAAVESRSNGGILQAGELEVHVDEHRAYLAGQALDLSPTEFRLLLSLVREQGRAVSHTKLLSAVWGPEYVDCRHYLRLYIKYLRSKVENDPGNPRFILNEWGVGYRLNASSAS